jgi:hypothetical protein
MPTPRPTEYNNTLVRDEYDVTRPTGSMPKDNVVYVELVQTGEPGVTADSAVLRLRQSPYGRTHRQTFIEIFSFADVEEEDKLHGVEPSMRLALDHIAGRLFLTKLAKMLDIDVDIKVRLRTGGKNSMSVQRGERGKDT